MSSRCRYGYNVTQADCSLCEDNFWCRWSKTKDEEGGEQ